jgi:hypothetical protein
MITCFVNDNTERSWNEEVVRGFKIQRRKLRDVARENLKSLKLQPVIFDFVCTEYKAGETITRL